jgi:hypothetical protein
MLMRRLLALLSLATLLPCEVALGASVVESPRPWRAEWIGIDEPATANQWMCFRKTFDLATAPKQALARIACDSRYWLWVNGELRVFEGQLKRGPTPEDTYYDTVDFQSALRPGKNAVALLVVHYGRNGFSHNSSGRAGLLFDAEIDGRPLLSDRTWKAIPHPAIGTTIPALSNFRLPESNIRFDARHDLPRWMEKDFDDSQWRRSLVFGPAGIAPWGKLFARPIPLWRMSELRDYTNASALPAQGGSKPVVARLPYNLHASPYLKIEAPAGRVIDIRSDAYPLFDSPTRQMHRHEYVTREGVQEWELPGWINGHEIHYSIPADVKILGLKYRETGYDADFVGRFESDDDALNRLWKKAERTLYVTMRDTYYDCPDRERAMWWGDAVNELGEAFYVFDAQRGPQLARKCILELAHWQREDGTLYAPIPSGRRRPGDLFWRGRAHDGNWDVELPTQMLATVGWYGLWTYYWYSGDRATIEQVYPAVRRYLDVWKIGADGLVVHRPGEWDWVDWGENVDVPVLENAWLHLALRAAIAMGDLTGNAADVAGYRRKLESIEARFNATFWKGDHYRSPGHDGPPDDRANALAVVAGLAESAKYPAIRRVLSTEFHASPYMEKYVIESLYLMNAPSDAVARMKRRYGPMIEQELTTLWELFGDKGQGDGTYNHGWSGGPLTCLSQYAAGLAPTQPGWAQFRVAPQLAALRRIAADVPTAHGLIRLKIDRDDARLRLRLHSPQGTQAAVHVPVSDSARVTLDGKPIPAVKAVPKADGQLEIIVAVPAGEHEVVAQLTTP